MVIKRNLRIGLREFGRKNKSYQIRLRVSYLGMRDDYAIGFNLTNPTDWDEDAQQVKPRAVGAKKVKASEINEAIRKAQYALDESFKYFEVNDLVPSIAELHDKFNEKMGNDSPAEMKRKIVAAKAPKEPGVLEVLDIFVRESGKKNAWKKASYDKFASLRRDLEAVNKEMTFADLDENGLTDFVCYLRDEKVLQVPRTKLLEGEKRSKKDKVGLRNSSIEKKLRFLHWFLNWAELNGYPVNKSFRTFKAKLQKTQKKIIFLTSEELHALMALQFPKSLIHLEHTRDCFLFMCFSGLRFSDLYALDKSDIKGDRIEFTTQKTADSLVIELNDVTSAILDKYKNTRGLKALPVPVNQRMNLYLKEICRMAEINEPIRIIEYKGSERIDRVYPKWMLIGTHAGRRTFITQSLSLGIPADVVMKWTGHADYQAMRPYIDVVDSVKAQEMKKLNSLNL